MSLVDQPQGLQTTKNVEKITSRHRVHLLTQSRHVQIHPEWRQNQQKQGADDVGGGLAGFAAAAVAAADQPGQAKELQAEPEGFGQSV